MRREFRKQRGIEKITGNGCMRTYATYTVTVSTAKVSIALVGVRRSNADPITSGLFMRHPGARHEIESNDGKKRPNVMNGSYSTRQTRPTRSRNAYPRNAGAHRATTRVVTVAQAPDG
jgi:hypothetical protein